MFDYDIFFGHNQGGNMLRKLAGIADKLDKKGLVKEADELDSVIKKLSQMREDVDPDSISEYLAGDDHPTGGLEDTVSSQTPEERLIRMLLASDEMAKRYGREMTPEEVAEDLGVADDEEIVSLIEKVMTPGASLYSY